MYIHDQTAVWKCLSGIRLYVGITCTIVVQGDPIRLTISHTYGVRYFGLRHFRPIVNLVRLVSAASITQIPIVVKFARVRNFPRMCEI